MSGKIIVKHEFFEEAMHPDIEEFKRRDAFFSKLEDLIIIGDIIMENTCRYCENYNTPRVELKLGDVFILHTAHYTTVGDGSAAPIPLNYCPACGRKLIKTSGQAAPWQTNTI